MENDEVCMKFYEGRNMKDMTFGGGKSPILSIRRT